MNRRWLLLNVLLILIAIVPFPSGEKPQIRVGSKKFTESVILGEMLTQLSQSTETKTQHLPELGGTQLIFNALTDGDLDVYVDYTGTIRKEILADEEPESDDAMREMLRKRGVLMSPSLGFNNSYALGMLESTANELDITRISDLRKHPQLRFRFSNEFIDRADGWPGLRTAYSLPQTDVQGLDHDIAYRQIASKTIDVIDVYTTDAKIKTLGLRVLEDDRQYFTLYEAVILYRDDLPTRRETAKASDEMLKLAGRIDEQTMLDLNNRTETYRIGEATVANEFLVSQFGPEFAGRVAVTDESMAARIWKYTLQHLNLVRQSLIPAILIAIPLGIVAAKSKALGQFILAVTGIIQTIPSLALLAFLMIPVVALNFRSIGVGSLTAVLALALYSLLPIVRNTFSGFKSIPDQYTEAAAALGMTPWDRLNKVELPMASRSILAGIKTAAVLNVGFATLGALIGAGGYGQPILTGIRLADNGLILMGVIPAALMALAFQGLFELVEVIVVPKGLRLKKKV